MAAVAAARPEEVRPFVALASEDEETGAAVLSALQGVLGGSPALVPRGLNEPLPTKKERPPLDAGVADGSEPPRSPRQASGRHKTHGAPDGVLKRDWVAKHSEIIPACVVLAVAFQPEVDATGAVEGQVKALHAALGRHADVLPLQLVLYQRSEVPTGLQLPGAAEQAQARAAQLGGRLGLASSSVTLLNSADEGGPPLRALAKRIADLTRRYVQNKVARIAGYARSVDRSTDAGLALSLRHNFKIAKLCNALDAPEKALKHFEVAYLTGLELATRAAAAAGGSSMLLGGPAGSFSSHELKAVAETLHGCICDLHLRGTQNVKALLDQLDRHVAAFGRLQGPEPLLFQHWEWMARQHEAFADALGELAGSGPLAGLGAIDAARCDPLYHLRRAASYAVRRREVAQQLELFRAGEAAPPCEAKLKHRLAELCASNGVTVAPSPFVGALPQLVCGDSTLLADPAARHAILQCVLYLEECKCRQGLIAFRLLERVYRGMSSAPGSSKPSRKWRAVTDMQARMAVEQMHLGALPSALKGLLQAASLYHREGWFALCRPLLKHAFECAEKLVVALPGNSGLADAFDVDDVGNRRRVIHGALKLLALEGQAAQQRVEVAEALLRWLRRPLKRPKDANAPDGARLKLVFSLDDLQTRLVEWSASFAAPSAVVGDTVHLQLRVRSLFAIPVFFDSLTVAFNDPRYEVTLVAAAAAAAATAPAGLVPPAVGDQALASGDSAPLRFEPREEKHFTLAVQVQSLSAPAAPQDDAPAAAGADIVRTLRATYLQVKLVGSEPGDRVSIPARPGEEEAFLSGISLWTADADVPPYTSRCASAYQFRGEEDTYELVVGPRATPWPPAPPRPRPEGALSLEAFQPTAVCELEHSGNALVGELYPLTVRIRANQDTLECAAVTISCDPPLQSSSVPFFFAERGKPLGLNDETLQPRDPLVQGLSLAPGETHDVQLFCCFSSLPYPSSTARADQCRRCTVRLAYTLPSTKVEVAVQETYRVPCCLAFDSKVQLLPGRGAENSDVLHAKTQCFVHLEIESSDTLGHDTLDVLQIVVEPSACATVRGPCGDAEDQGPKLSILEKPQRLCGGDRLSLGFDVVHEEVGADAVLGCVAVNWARSQASGTSPPATMYIPLPRPHVEFSQFRFSVKTHPAKDCKVLGAPFQMVVAVANLTEIPQELDLTVRDVPSFYRDGLQRSKVALGPLGSSEVALTLVPLATGNLTLPSVLVESPRLMTQYVVPSAGESTLFVAPS